MAGLHLMNRNPFVPSPLPWRGMAFGAVLFMASNLVLHASAWCASAELASSGMVVADDGQTVLDVRSKLAWSRCVEGMQWTGKTCSGRPLLMSHAQAMAAARARLQADGGDWRLPRVTELQRLLERAGRRSGLDKTLFPAAPSDLHWTRTVHVNSRTGATNPYNYGNIMRERNQDSNQMAFLHGWAVDMGSGEARGDVLKRHELPVRLLRSLPE